MGSVLALYGKISYNASTKLISFQKGAYLMSRIKSCTERIEMRCPKPLLESIDLYQAANSLPSRTAAIMELIRAGLEAKAKNS